MSQSDVQGILKRVSADDSFKQQLLSDLGTLAQQNKSVKDQLVTIVNPESSKKKWRTWWRDFFSNLTTVGFFQITLTGILILLFVISMVLTFMQITTPPVGTMMPDKTVERWDPYTRAKDLLTLIIPIFATIVSFWLGFSIQENRVNRATQTAQDEREMRAQADKKMGMIEGYKMGMPDDGNVSTAVVKKDLTDIINKEPA